MENQPPDTGGFVPATSVDFSRDAFNAASASAASSGAEAARLARRDSLARMQKLAATYDTLQEQLSSMARRESVLGDRTNAHAAAGGHSGKPPTAPMHTTTALQAPTAHGPQSHPHQHPGSAAAHAPPPPTQQHQAQVQQVQQQVLVERQPQALPQPTSFCQLNAAPSTPAAAASADAAPSSVAPPSCLVSNRLTSGTDGNHGMPRAAAGGGGGGADGDALFDFALAHKDSRVGAAAVELLHDPELLSLCEDGLHRQLTRTKDGATDRSRIQELASLVKHLRKCVREIAGRASCVVDRCVKLEREHSKQMEGVALTSESTLRSVEAELAGAKKDLAQLEATFKTDKAKWGADLEDQRYETLRLRRELERVTEERERARGECARAEATLRVLEQDFKDHRKQSTQAMRDHNSASAEAVSQLTEEAEKREAALRAAQDEHTRLSKRLELQTSCVDTLRGELQALQQAHATAKEVLKDKAASQSVLSARLEEVRGQLEEAQRQLSAAGADKKDLEARLAGAAADGKAAEARHEASAARADALGTQLAALEEQQGVERGAWEARKAELEAIATAAEAREASLLEEKRLLKEALGRALAHKEELGRELEALKKAHASLQFEERNLRNHVDFVTGNQQAADERAEKLEAALAALKERLAAVDANTTAKEARLQELEGEFGALKEVLGESGQRDVVNNLLRKISTLQTAVASSDAARRRLHNELVEARGNIRVFCRVRPPPAAGGSGASAVRCLQDQCGLAISVDGKEHGMEFDRVYGPSATQHDVFAGVSELVQSALDGYHVCLFSYGQTGAGKTYTMQGADTPSGRGIIPRAVDQILATAERLAEQEYEYTMHASFIEVYNNQLRDLLGGSTAPYIGESTAIKHDTAGGHTTVVGVSKVELRDADAAGHLIARAAAARASEATAMNATSSRSHSVFMLYISGCHAPSGTQLKGCLCLVDLAGSERLDRSLAEGQRKAEACAINASLSSIGDVFAALASKSSHVPYRNSKLTYLLQPCLGGHGKTLMFVNINPEPMSAYESLCSLKFAQKVNGCETAARGGARRNTSGSGAPAGPPAADGDKRLSLPASRSTAAAAAPEPSAKRMSLAAGAKRTAGAAGGGLPLGSAPKRVRPGGT